MPSFFTFQQGTESRRHPSQSDSTPLLGRFRAVPHTPGGLRARRSSLNLFGSFSAGRSLGRGLERGFDTVFGSGEEDDEEELGRWKAWWKWQRELWLEPKERAVARAVDRFWGRWWVLIGLPAALAVAWCAIPFPQYDIPYDDGDSNSLAFGTRHSGHRTPGHGEARVEINFWFFLFVYYGPYNITALMWITKVFNIYSLNWWPQSLGFPFTVSVIAAISILVPIPIYYMPDSRYYSQHNTGWICWTFFTMAMPLIIAFGILLSHERHLGLRHSLSETQRLFTSSWWTGETETLAVRDRGRRPQVQQSSFDPNAPLEVALASDHEQRYRQNRILRKRWLPASFVRFIWFVIALTIAMLAYVLGEAYAEIYLRTLPHSTFDTLFYVYSWVLTVHSLDGLTGWILGGEDGERVNSFPLGWIFKLYFNLTYQTYVRALYARLRSPEQFIYLQILSSSLLIILAPLTISAPFHYILTLLNFNGQSLSSYQKFCSRNVFIRGIAENVSMLAFLGSILVLHYGSNKDVYPYFAFDRVNNNATSTITTSTTSSSSPLPVMNGNLPMGGSGESYDFGLTFYASIVTWACEITAGWVVRRILWFGWKVDVTGEGKADLASWPEQLPTGVVVMVHVLQNMLFSIVRLRFH